MILERSNSNRGSWRKEWLIERGREGKKSRGCGNEKEREREKMLEIDKEEGYVLWKWK